MTEKKKPEGAFWNNWKNTGIPATGTIVSKPGMSGAYAGPGGQSISIAVDPFVADLMSMSPDGIFQTSTLLKNAGYLRNTTRKYNKTLGDAYSRASMDWSNESARTGRPALTFREFLIENITPETGATKKPSLPTRQVYEVRKADIEADINEFAKPKLQREIIESDKQQDWYKNLLKAVQDMYAKGTVTTTKQVVNPKTGKKENVVIQSPKFSKEQIEEKITTTLVAADPESAARANRLDFARRYFGGGRG